MIRFTVVLSCLLLACVPIPAPVPLPPDADAAPAIVEPPVADADVPFADADDSDVDEAKRPTAMGKACARLLALGCPEGKPTPKGLSCETVFHNVASFPGLDGSFNTACVAGAKSVADVRTRCKVACR